MTHIKYCIYARKSSESDERQALSIDGQIQEMKEKALKEWITITGTLIESHSAKETGKRPVFNELIKEIKKGTYTGIVTWAPDRLSRNAWDLWSLVDLMDWGKLQEIRTNGQNFRNSPNEKFLLMILCSQAKLENDNKWVNVVRWLKNKAQQGFRPWVAPLWYLNKKSYERNGWSIILDPDRAPIIKQIFEKVAHDWCKWREIYTRLINEIWFTTRSNKKATLSWVYRALNDTFYYWKFEYPKWSWNWYKWSHEPIITKELFEHCQRQLNLWVRYRKRHRTFDFTRIMKCGNCDSGITAHEKHKVLKNGNINSYIYYNCTKSKDLTCRERFIEEQNLVQQLLKMIESVDINEINVSQNLRDEIERYYNFQKLFEWDVQKKKNIEKQVGIRDYMKYLLREWTRDEKREVLSYIKSNIYVKNKLVILR